MKENPLGLFHDFNKESMNIEFDFDSGVTFKMYQIVNYANKIQYVL
jgi:hypothetical protein